MKRLPFLLSLLCTPLILNAQDKKPEPAPATPATPAAEVKPAAGNPSVDIKTSLGSFTVELNKERAPITVANFLSYVEKKHYDGTVFHRVIDNFMIQGGGFEKKGDQLAEKETAAPIKNEARDSGLKNELGTIAMARTGLPDSATAQFFINVKDNTFLNPVPTAPTPTQQAGYAAFGKVTKGMEVVNQIKGVKTTTRPLNMRAGKQQMTQPAQDVPVADVIIESIRVVTP